MQKTTHSDNEWFFLYLYIFYYYLSAFVKINQGYLLLGVFNTIINSPIS